jgi:3-oxoacyl-[acyl-carrier protein] reductase
MAREILDGAGGDDVRAQSSFGRVASRGGRGRCVVARLPEARFASRTIIDVIGASYL